MNFQTVFFSLLLTSSLIAQAESIHFIIGSTDQIKARVRSLQQSSCVDLNFNTRMENPTNNRDDDANGYVDDTHGFNFQTGIRVGTEFNEFYSGDKPSDCSKWIPIVLQPNARRLERLFAAEYIILSPIYGDTLLGDLGRKTHTEVNIHFPSGKDMLQAIESIVLNRPNRGAVYLLRPF